MDSRVYCSENKVCHPRLTGIRYFPRWLAGTLCYVAFGLGGVLLSLTLLPVLRLLPGTPLRKIARVQKIIQITFQFFVKMLTWAGVIKVNPAAAKVLFFK